MADHQVTLNKNTENYATPFLLMTCCSETVQFTTTGGAFTIIISNAHRFFKNVPKKLNINLDSNDPNKTDSDTYTVESDLDINYEIQYILYSIDDKKDTDAPPRIIIIPTQ